MQIDAHVQSSTVRLSMAAISLLMLGICSSAFAQTRNYYQELGYYEQGGWVQFGTSPDDVCQQYAAVWGWDRNGYSTTVEQILPGQWNCQRYHDGTREPDEWTRVFGYCQLHPAPILTGSDWSYPYWDVNVGDCYCSAPQKFDISVEWCSGPQFYLTAPPPKKSDPPCSSEGGPSPPKVGEPINVATGAVVTVEGDCKASIGRPLAFARYYDSSDSAGTNLGPAWRGSFSRHVVAQKTEAIQRTYEITNGTPSDNSSKYLTAADACTSGFIDIRPRVPDWSGATTQYVDGICELIKNGLVIGSIPVYSTFGIPLPTQIPTRTVYNYVRDDGQVIRSWMQGSVLRGSAGQSLRVSLTSNSFAYIDNNDNVELYSASGTLQSITSRAGVVQTMAYDAQGRLSNVTDSFGHQLALSYDTQNRLISVTRQ
jgi:YD repeat-containing protein